MKFSNANHHEYVSKQYKTIDQALAKSTHLGIGAHQDDLEVMAGHGILQCYQSDTQNFFGVTCTDGGGSARTGEFKDFSDKQMMEMRKQEQVQSARLGEYAGVVQLGYPSATIKNKLNDFLLQDLRELVSASHPEVIYTHNPADKHGTHVAITHHLVQALRALGFKPKSFYGCEVWRGLDWLPDALKVPLAISNPQLIEKLIACHRSQTAGGKRYDHATVGRMKANATFFESHKVDKVENVWFAIDLMPLLDDPSLSLYEFVNSHILKMKDEIRVSLENLRG